MLDRMITKVTIRNYKSLRDVEVELGPLTILVGPNGSGKSNFIDALMFVRDCLADGPRAATRKPGRGRYVWPQLGDAPAYQMAFAVHLRHGRVAGSYSFTLHRGPHDAVRVGQERAEVDVGGEPAVLVAEGGAVLEAPPGLRPAAVPDRLALPLVGGAEQFAALYGLLTAVERYRIQPGAVASPVDRGSEARLREDGANAAAVAWQLLHLRLSDPWRCDAVVSSLRGVLPGLRAAPSVVRNESAGTLEIQLQLEEKTGRRVLLPAESMSEGTLRALGVLLAAYQVEPPSLMAVEEPEATVHPAAAGVVMDALLDAAERTQVIVATHSADLLEHGGVRGDHLRGVEWVDGASRIGPLGEGAVQVLRQRLMTLAELQRDDRLRPAPPPQTEQAQQP